MGDNTSNTTWYAVTHIVTFQATEDGGAGTGSHLFGFLLLARLVVALDLAVGEVLHERDGLFEDGGRLTDRRHQQRIVTDAAPGGVAKHG